MVDLPFNEDYVRRLARGDPEVQKDFVSRFSTLLRIKLRNRLRSHQAVEDICQETFARVLASLASDGLRSPERLGGFVNSVCNNVILESFRASIRHPQMPEEAPQIRDEAADPAHVMMLEQRRQSVVRILDGMPAKDRELLRLVFFEERSKERICQEMHVNPEYLRVLIHRAKLRFRTAMEQIEPRAEETNRFGL